MARQTTNYGFKISEGNDLVNPLTDIFPNFENIDTDLKGVSDSAVGTATELLTGTVHALVRSDSDRNVFTFTATSNFKAGETFTLDGVQVTALTPDGQTLSTGCYIIGSEVLVAVKGTLMTVYVNPSKALDSDKLDGHDSTYYATASDVSDLSGDVSTLSSKVGLGTLTVGNDCVDGINTLNTHVSALEHNTFDTEIPINRPYTTTTDGYYTLTNNSGSGLVAVQLNGVEMCQEVWNGATEPYRRFTLYVKKGMTISWVGTTLSGYFSTWHPLVS